MKTLQTFLAVSAILCGVSLAQQQPQASSDPDVQEFQQKQKELESLRQRIEKRRAIEQSKLTEGITGSIEDTAKQFYADGVKIDLAYAEPDADYHPNTFVWHVSGPDNFSLLLNGQKVSFAAKRPGQYQVIVLAQDGTCNDAGKQCDGRNQRQHVLYFKVNPIVEWQGATQAGAQ